MKKRITGIATMRRGSNQSNKIKVKGWKVNPYLFLHKVLNDKYKPVSHSEWSATHIPTGYALYKGVSLRGALTLKKYKEVTNKYFPAWIMKTVGKKMNVSEEIKIRWHAYKDEIKLLQESQGTWEI